MTTFTVAVVTAGLSQPSSTRLLADQLADGVRTAAAARGDRVEVITLELRELAHDITDNLLTGFPGVTLQTALDAAGSADALIAVTPVFSGTYSGLFKSFFDVLDRDALVGTPVLLAATGGSARHSLVLDYALRPLFAYLKADIVPTGVFAATADFGSDDAGRSLADRIGRAAGELLSRLSPTGNESVRVDVDLGPGPTRHRGPAKGDPFQNLVPFEELLARR
jgi:FMN reductase